MEHPFGDLPPAAQQEVRHAVDAVSSGQRDRVEPLLAADTSFEDLYVWTYDWGDWPQVHVTAPPGPIATWSGYVNPFNQPGWIGKGWSVGVDVWRVEEAGRSDLTLEFELFLQADGNYRASVYSLHVM